MMEEVSITVAYDAHIEEEILACLVAESRPKHTLGPQPNHDHNKTKHKKPKLRQSQKQLQEDPIDRYQRENHQLQQTSLRLEQENDNLAHKLVTSKIALRNSLDQTEDRVDELTKELFQTRHHLKVTEEEKNRKEEEAIELKEAFRRELEKADFDVKKMTGILTDYKQICSQLTSRLEKQQASTRVELETLKSTVLACSRCRQVLDMEDRAHSRIVEGTGTIVPMVGGSESGTTETDHDESTGTGTREPDQKRDQEKDSLSAQVRELEKELALTKLQMVEAKCKIQELEHQRGVMASDLQVAKNSWFNKTLSSMRSASGSFHGIGAPKHVAPAVGWTLHRPVLSALSSQSLSLTPREGRGEDD